jgi:ABC-type polysaccharide/polyol phosphate export permease
MTPLASAWAYRDLARHLVLRDLRLKYKGSTLGFAWSLANPLLMAAVYTVAFKYIVRLPVEHFPLFLLSGLLPWTFFTTALAGATSSIVDNGALVRKVAFPHLVLPLAAVLSQFVQSALMYALIVPAFALIEGTAGPTLFALIPLALLLLLFTAGLGLALAAAYVAARDTRHLLEVGTQIWFWLTPIVYAPALVPEKLTPVLLANPMAWFADAFHGAVVDGRWPAWPSVLALTLAACASAALGLTLFTRAERRFVERV